MTSAAVRFRSTRSEPGAAGAAAGGASTVDFWQALTRGLAADGGLYVPVDLPKLPAGWQRANSLADLARLVLPPFMGREGAEAVARGLDFEVPVVSLGQDMVLELFHGPTAAFKDVGARSLARLMQVALERSGGSATILVATSGDTGSAVADAFAGLERLQVALLYPQGGVSPVQESQLSAARPGVRAFAVEGTFDDCQRMVKEAFADPALAEVGLSSANSINVGRLLPQTLYYLWGVAQALERGKATEPLTVVVPSGNLGNLTAGLMAQAMGMDGVEFVAAHNANDYFARFLAGDAEPYAFSPSVATLSNAMDVGAPSNFERLYAMFGPELRSRVKGVAVDDHATLARMRVTHERFGYLACPHTAVGLEAWARLAANGVDGRQALVLATAHPAKFPESVKRATGQEPPVPATLAAFASAPKRVERLAPTLSALRSKLLAEPRFSA